MKINEPVTDHEVKLRNGQELVTKTDLKGIITYTNPAFVEISGFSEAELVGKTTTWYAIPICRSKHLKICGIRSRWGAHGTNWLKTGVKTVTTTG